MFCRAAPCRPQVVGVGRLQQILRARTLLLLEKDVVLGVAVRADGALFAVGAADGFALQLHRQGNALRVVCKLKEQKKKEANKSKIWIEKHTRRYRPRLSVLPGDLKAILLFLPLVLCLTNVSLRRSEAMARLWGSGSKQRRMNNLASTDSDSGTSG